MSSTLQAIIKTSLPMLLKVIRNHPPGVLEESFVHGPKLGGITIGGFVIQWWVTDNKPFYMLALELSRYEPSLLDRYSVDEVASAILGIIRENLNGFNFTPFCGSRRPRTDLLMCASPVGMEAVTRGILDLISTSGLALFVFPVQRLKPEMDVIGPDLVWLTRSAAKRPVEQLLQLTDPRLTFDRFPPLLDSSARLLQDEDSMLGLITNGWEAAAVALRRLAGILCLVLPDHEATSKSVDEQAAVTAALFCDGRIEIRGLGPFLPLLIDSKAFNREAIDRLSNFLKPRRTKEGENRFRVALEFLALGWLLRESQAFMNWCIAIDALFGVRELDKWKQSIKDGVQKRLSGLTGALDDRIGLLIDIRSDLLHGRCSTVSSSKNYLRYWKRFQADPLRDLFLILRECLIREP